MRALFLLLFCFVAQNASAQEQATANINSINADSDHRALFNYQMFCQGCHSVDGSGHKSVPELKGFMHKFMFTQQGREYLVRVPGAANADLDDEQLTDLMNWMVRNFADPADGVSWRPFDVAEVSQYRKNPLNETIKYREGLIANLKLESEL